MLNQVDRLYRLPASSFFLFGLRGVGKSTWVRARLPDAHRIDLLDETLYQALLADPSQFAGELRTVEPGRWVIVDEVQRLPGLLNEVHRAIEERRLRFALLGSSARKLRSAGVNLLAGRAVWREMFPLTPEELADQFDLERALEVGSVPLVLAAADPADTLRSYVQLYLREEIKGEGLVRNLPGFARFLPVAGLLHGQTVNVSGLARDAGVARTTVAGYLDILDDTLVTARLDGYEARLRVRERKLPKLYWTDPGIVRAVRGDRGPVGAEAAGALFEGWVFTLLRTYAGARDLAETIRYWSPADARDTEVDFLLTRGEQHLAIEVKAARRVDHRHLKGLRAIAPLGGLTRRVLVYRGDRPQRTEDGIDVLPAEAFAAELASGGLWP